MLSRKLPAGTGKPMRAEPGTSRIRTGKCNTAVHLNESIVYAWLPSILSVLQVLTPHLILSHKCHTNIGSILNGDGATVVEINASCSIANSIM
jgi:hypothetical protein